MRKRILNEKDNYDIEILLLDDDANMLNSLKGLIERNTYKCTTTDDPREALNMLQDIHSKINIFITDYLMIGTTGIDIVNKLRESNPDIYIILLTGFVHNMPWEIAIRQFDIDSYAEKDIDFKDLLLKVEIAVKNVARYKLHGSKTGLTFEEKLRMTREHKNMTQDEVAEALGVVRTTIVGYENGTIRPGFENIRKLGKLYNISYDFLLGE